MIPLVTGASGFLGQAVVKRLLETGTSNIRCFVRPNSAIDRLLQIQATTPGARLEFVTGNLTCSRDVRHALDGVSIVYHLAAEMRGVPATIFRNTVLASKYLLDAASELRPKRVVLVSSLCVYNVNKLPFGTRIDENTELEQHPEKRDEYSHAKLWQEMLFQDYSMRTSIDLIILRPGPIYGPGSKRFPARVGIDLGPWLLHFGGRNVLPLTYVENCAEAVVIAGVKGVGGSVYNIVDDGLPTSSEYVRTYCKEVGAIRILNLPYFVLQSVSFIAEAYQIALQKRARPRLTPYQCAALWKGHQFSNEKLKNLGWSPIVCTKAALRKTFDYLRVAAGAVSPAMSDVLHSQARKLLPPSLAVSCDRKT